MKFLKIMAGKDEIDITEEDVQVEETSTLKDKFDKVVKTIVISSVVILIGMVGFKVHKHKKAKKENANISE